jgi:hypothetical protein
MVSDSANTDPSFSVHLQSLQSFGQELRTQLDGLRQPLDRLSQLLQRELPLGSFGEAYSLAGHHLSMAGQMYSLLQAVRQAVDFSGQVTGQVVASYQQYDQQAATALADPSAATADPGVATASPTAGGVASGVQPVGVQVSLSQPASVQLSGASLPAHLPVTVTRQSITYSDPANANLSGA